MRQVEPVNKAYRFQTKCKDYVYINDPEDIEFHPKINLNIGLMCLDRRFTAST